MNQRTITSTLVITALIFLSLIGVAIYTYSARAGKIQAVITVYPDDATVFIDGKQEDSREPYITPGKHTFSAIKEGFLKASETLTITSELKTIILLPTPDSDAALDWAKQSDVQANRESLGGQQANIRGLSLGSQNPLIDKLPYVDIAGPFALDYGYKGEGNTSVYYLIHDSTPDGRQAAFQWIRAQGVDPTTLDIRYDEYHNPLTQGGL